MKILYAEDELGLSMAVAEVLKMEGFEVTSVMDGLSADEILQKEHFDMVVLDIMMPGMEGTQVAENMRKRSDYTPVLLLTAKAETEDRIDGLNKGADDYLAKPFAMGELVARVKAMIRRNRDYQQTVLNLANVTLDLESNELSARSGSLILSVKEAKLLALFLEKESYRLERIAIWKNPEAYEKGYQTIQGRYAIGSGGLFGRGFGESIQKLGFVPEAQNDMIFSIICEELGFVGATILMLVFLMLIWRFMVIAVHAPDLFGSLIAAGAMGHIAIQVILNVAVVTNTIPNTGITLPFISYGGTSVLFLLSEMGLVLAVSRWQSEKKCI